MTTSLGITRSIGARLAGVIAGTLLLAAVGSGIGLWALERVADETHEIVSRSVQTERLVSDWYRNTSVAVRRTTAIAVSSDASLADYFAKEAEASTDATTTEATSTDAGTVEEEEGV